MVIAGRSVKSRSLDLQSDSHLLPDTLPTALRGPVQSKIPNCCGYVLNFPRVFSFANFTIAMIEIEAGH